MASTPIRSAIGQFFRRRSAYGGNMVLSAFQSIIRWWKGVETFMDLYHSNEAAPGRWPSSTTWFRDELDRLQALGGPFHKRSWVIPMADPRLLPLARQMSPLTGQDSA